MKPQRKRAVAALAVIGLSLLSGSGCSGRGGAFTFVQLCDTQLGFGGYEHDVASFEQAVEQINALRPDVVFICGDLVNQADDKSFADFSRIKDRLIVPCHCASGNHDVGNDPTHASLERYRKLIGADYYSLEHKGYIFVIVNTQLWKSPLEPESHRQDAWLADTLAGARAKNYPVVIVGHHPVFLTDPDEKDDYYNLPGERRKDLLSLYEQHGVVAVLGGHTHSMIVNDYHGIQLVNGETTSRNFDGRPLGFRLWTVVSPTSMEHEFIPLRESDRAADKPASSPVKQQVPR